MLQEVKDGLQPSGACTLPECERNTKNKKTSYKSSVPETIPPLTIQNRAGSKFPEDAYYISPPGIFLKFNVCLLKYFAWQFCWWFLSNEDERVPSNDGLISSTGSVPERKTTIEYCKSTIRQPLTQYETVQELLQQSEETTKAVCQKYTINTLHLGVCTKALSLIWTFLDKFEEHLVIPGPFYTEMNFIGTLANHKMWRSGYADIIEEARIVKKGCMKNMLNGKAFASAFSVWKWSAKLLNACCWRCSTKKNMLKYILHVCLLSLIHVIGVILMQLWLINQL